MVVTSFPQLRSIFNTTHVLAAIVRFSRSYNTFSSLQEASRNQLHYKLDSIHEERGGEKSTRDQKVSLDRQHYAKDDKVEG